MESKPRHLTRNCAHSSSRNKGEKGNQSIQTCKPFNSHPSSTSVVNNPALPPLFFFLAPRISLPSHSHLCSPFSNSLLAHPPARVPFFFFLFPHLLLLLLRLAVPSGFAPRNRLNSRRVRATPFLPSTHATPSVPFFLLPSFSSHCAQLCSMPPLLVSLPVHSSHASPLSLVSSFPTFASSSTLRARSGTRQRERVDEPGASNTAADAQG